MLRAGMIRQLTAGVYSWLPIGLRVLKKVEQIVRDEMNAAGAQELLLPVMQPSDLWNESGRLNDYGPELLRLYDRHSRETILGPTHEEVITNIIRSEVNSYKQLPLNLYQIQTKFRDEIRPRFGIMRGREFLMKDAYSFHASEVCLRNTYRKMFEAYTNIFERLGLKFTAVEADSGSIGGSKSHEFHVLASSGEDAIAFDPSGKHSANVEKAQAISVLDERKAPIENLNKISTPNVKTINELVTIQNIPIVKTVKTIIVKASEKKPVPFVALLVRGDHELNEIKASQLDIVQNPLEFASEKEVSSLIGGSSAFGVLLS